ncbi:MAG: hypothetical protein FWJ70_15530 [Micromonosporaceae bacterium]|jgi:hypothetical protein
MTDPIDDLTVRTAFERLRADATATIHPPGVAAARRSVRRRRYAASAAGGLAALLLSSGAAAALWWEAPDGTGPAPVVTAASPSAAPSPSTSRADAPPDGTALAEMAWDALTGLVGDEARIFAYGGLAVPDDLDMPFPGDFELMPGMAPGRYRMTVVCGGDGKGIVTLTMGGESATATARCGTTPEEIAAGAATVAMERVGSENVSVEVGYSSDDAPEQSHVVLMALEFIG